MALLCLLSAAGCTREERSDANVAVRHDTVRNASGIALSDTVREDATDVVLRHACSGTERYAAQLDAAQLGRDDLHGAIPCVAADFDGNGYLDFALWGAVSAGTRRFLVLFFGGDRVVRRQLIEAPGRDALFLYPPHDEPDEFGSPVSRQPGLVQPGEGALSYYYVYDPATKRLERSEGPSELR